LENVTTPSQFEAATSTNPPPRMRGSFLSALLSQPSANRWYIPAVVLCATFVSYAGALALGFVFDDHVLIVTNDSIRSWRYLPSYFTSHIWSFRYPHLLANYYRPLFLVWLRLNDALFGLHPWGWHLTSVLAHLAVTYLVYRLSLKLTRDPWVAGLAGTLFGLHPVHVEAVADITSIQEPLSSFFILAAILSFGRSREPAARRWWALAAWLATAAALLTKESGLMLPILVSGFVWIYCDAGEAGSPEGRRSDEGLTSALRAAVPFWMVVMIYVLLRIWALKGFAHVVTPLSVWQNILTIPLVSVFYLRLLVWPSGLSCYYDVPYVATPRWDTFVLPAAVLVVLAMAVVLWYRRERRSDPGEARVTAFASVFTTLTLLPVLNFRFLPSGEVAHDRYLYLPSVGVFLLLASRLRQVGRRVELHSVRPAWAAVAVLLLAGALSYSTVRQCLFWSDDLTLNYRAHEIAPHNVYATTSLAAAVAGRRMDKTAMALYQQALAIDPNFWRANVNLGYLYYAHDDFRDAARFLARACEVDPTDGDQFLYLGMARLRMGQLAEAEKAVRTALLVRPGGKNYHLGLAIVLEQEGRLAEAREEIETELAADARNQAARDLLGKVDAEIKAPASPDTAAPGP